MSDLTDDERRVSGSVLRESIASGHTLEKQRDALCDEVARLRGELAARDAEWLAAMPRCEHLDGNRCDAAATRECGDSTTGEWLFCDSHAPFTGEAYRDLPQAPLIRRASARDGEGK